MFTSMNLLEYVVLEEIVNMKMQSTILNPISCYGIGIHSGKKTQVTLKPAPKDTGITFIRTDVTSVFNVIKATYDNVFDTQLSTSIKNNANVKVSTVEHLIAAIWGCGIDNIVVELDGPEVPIMDGSSKPFVFMLECAGINFLKSGKRQLKILKEFTLEDNGSYINLTPGDKTSLDVTIDFASNAIGVQGYKLEHRDDFNSKVADSRTFGFVAELEYMKSLGLARGASLDNAIGIAKGVGKDKQDVILNHKGLRHSNEFARHKLLDLAGDLFLSEGNIIANIKGYKTSHGLNNMLLHKILHDPNICKWEEM